ncbi:MAG: FecR domain-containing protein [Akkermansiaceae bacterium]|nr:FecR domain-containing protein [Akkermansiaceae bacterium]MCP5548608.1 FecR domain-containing protein [Akkermansiaceae bacterium]
MHTEHPDSEFDALCADLLDGSIDPAGRERLFEIVRDDPALLDELRRQLLVSGSLFRMNPKFSDERFSFSIAGHLRKLGDESPSDFPQEVGRRIRTHRMQRRAVIALAACLALAAIPLALLKKRGTGGAPVPLVAVATRISGGENGAMNASVTIHENQRIELDEGMMRLEFTNGAVVAVEAPARFTVKSAKEIILQSGNLNAWCPDTAHGFRVDTESATLTDLGTSFGVSARPDGSADFMVLDGEVEVSNSGENRKLLKGKAVRATSREGLEDLTFEPSPFTRTWPVASGIQSTTGEVVPAPPNTPEIVALHEDDNHILVIPERRSFKLPPRLPADIVEPGNFGGRSWRGLHGANPILSEGTQHARSYLLRYNPVGVLDYGVFKRFEGSVTFDRPVLGLITSTGKLRLTDKIATAAPIPEPEQNPDMRGVEGGPKTEPDTITLSEDRRTVSVVFFAGESVDEIRVITAGD